MKNTKKLNVIVTGATRGIGLAILKKYLSSGHRVIGICSNTANVPSGDEDLKNNNCEWIAADFSKRDETLKLAEKLSRFDPDVLINNAGINKINFIYEINPEDWFRVQEVNLNAPFLLCNELSKGMRKRKCGWIINVTSIFSHITKEKRSSYSSSKFGLVGLTKAMALDLAPDGVLVNAVGPGFIDTELTRAILKDEQIKELVSQVPLKRLGQAEEIAKLVCFLGSTENTFITGQNIIADGGFTIA